MKSIPALAAAVLLTFCMSCKKEAPGEPAVLTQPTAVDTATITDTEIVTDTIAKKPAGDTSQNALDWPGTYAGTLPCGGECKGIKTEIILNNDAAYSLSSQFLGQETKPRIFKGKFSWDETGSIITLDAEGDHLKFKVQEGSLKKLDKFGDPEQGGPQEAYVLAKKN
jgi:uncharacterized lipoprotein NlpE involved in copper resistance